MNPIALPIAELKPALIGLGKVLDRHAGMPVLTTIKIERTTDGWITLTATDLDSFVTVRLEQPTEGAPATVLVPCEQLLKVMKTCGKREEILVERTGPRSVSLKYAIGQQFAEVKTETWEVEEFPEIPKVKGDAVPLSETLRESLRQAFECASTDETRYILNGAYFDVSQPDCHQVVATDGRHLYSSNSFQLPLVKSFVVRTHRFLKWKDFSQDGEWKIKTGPAAQEDDPGQIQISSRRWRFITKEITGNYPNWRQVIPSESQTESSFEVEAAAVENVIQTIQRMPCHDRSNFAIGLELGDGTLKLLGKSGPGDPWTKVEVSGVKVEGKALTIFLNRDFLSKALKFGLTRVDLIDSMSPLRFSNGGRQMIVMPTRENSVPPPQPVATAIPAEKGVGEAEPLNPETAEQPAAVDPAVAQPMEGNTIVNQATTTDSPDRNSRPPTLASKIEEALVLIDTLKDSLQEGITGLKDLSSKLKLLQREQKSSEREYQSIRSTLRSLQSVKI